MKIRVMKRTNVIKITKGILFSAIAVFLLTLAWANWSPATYSEKNVPSVTYISVDLSSCSNSEKYKEVETYMISTNGITACTVNSSAKLAGVMFISSLISKKDIREKISAILGNPVNEKVFEPMKNGCPVGGLTSFLLSVKQTLRFRS